MSRYRKIDVEIWSDRAFRALSKGSPSAQFLWIYLLTGPHTGVFPGLFSIGVSGISERLGWTRKATKSALDEIENAGRNKDTPMMEIDSENLVIWLPAAVKYNPPESPNVCKAWARALREIPQCELRDKAEESALRFLEAFAEAFKKAFREGLGKGFVESRTGTGTGTGTREDTPLPPAKLAGGALDKPTRELVPYEQIRALYNARRRGRMPDEKPLKAGVGSSVAIAASWKRNRGTDRENALAFYDDLFRRAASSPFLRGESNVDWRSSLGWLMGPTNERKVLSGCYESDDESPRIDDTDFRAGIDATGRVIDDGEEMRRWEASHDEHGRPIP